MTNHHESELPLSKNDRSDRSGHIFIISAPSGSGKTTLCRALMDHMPGLLYSTSYTTRLPRNGEQDGTDYYFVSKEEFEKGIKDGRWAEFAEVHGNYYGTSTDILDNAIHSGQDILLDIDVQGAKQILKQYPDSVTIFIQPPSIDILRQRLEKRGADSQEVIERRLKDAGNELARKDMYRHVVENDDLQKAIDHLIAVVKQYR
jgi:guanylate kinase